MDEKQIKKIMSAIIMAGSLIADQIAINALPKGLGKLFPYGTTGDVKLVVDDLVKKIDNE